MPGKFVDEVIIYQCGTHSDGSAIMCSKIGYAKIPFLLSEDAVGWQEVGKTEIHIPLTKLAEAMKGFGITMDYDEQELALRFGPKPGAGES